LALAERLSLDEKTTLELLAHAASLDMVKLEWEITCPECQGEVCVASQRNEAGCRFCGREYDLLVEHDIQLTFTASPGVRRLSPQADDPDYRHRVNAPYGSTNALALLNFPAFRARLVDQFLRGNTGLRIREITVLATDLRDSTGIYTRHGDSAAYRLVSEHFGVIAPIVERHAGFLVKTLGDGVMAAFPKITNGLHVAAEIQKRLNFFWNTRREQHLALRVGLHSGPALLVFANGTLDIFGTTVNIAFRIARLAQGGDIVVTNTALNTDTAARLELNLLGEVETQQTVLHGFDDQCIFHRIILPHKEGVNYAIA
ncbi:MAG: adenylate/guanylate cyclase domain-containing protein, partial [Chloroflexi bacterium]|nr:adenylate/guanylate cyclase domain-containing protein [Chloroflexota bacterium]